MSFMYNPNEPQSPLEMRIILDSGSQRLYVTNRVKNALSLVSEGEQSMSIITFGRDQKNRQVCEVVKIGMKTNDSRVKN